MRGQIALGILFFFSATLVACAAIAATGSQSLVVPLVFAGVQLLSLFLFGGKALAASLVVSFVCGVVRLTLARNAPCLESVEPSSLSELRKGDILLFGKRSVFAQGFIQLPTVLTRDLSERFWVHAGVYVNGFVWQARGGGVTAIPLAAHLKHGDPVRVLRHRYADAGVIDAVVDYCASRRGRPYAFLAVFYLALVNLLPVSFRWLVANAAIDRFFLRDERFSCAELVVEAFAAAGHPIVPHAGWRVIAADLLDSPVLFEPLAEGAAEPALVEIGRAA